MNKIFFLFITHCVICNSSFTQNWINISPFSDVNSGIGGHFISAQKGWIYQTANYKGNKIYFTNDSAKSFDLIYAREDTADLFLFLQMVDSVNGWTTIRWQNPVYPHNSHDSLFKTTDGGYSWTNITDTSFFGNYGHNVTADNAFYFVNKDIGFCDGINHETNERAIYKTIDGGITWYQTNTPTASDIDTNLQIAYRIEKFFFLNENIGWAACSYGFHGGITLYTINGGENWIPGYTQGAPNLYDIHFVSETKGGTAGRNHMYSSVLITNDNFNSVLYEYRNWAQEMNQFAYLIYFQSESTIWITGEPGIIYRSTNGGAAFNQFQVIENIAAAKIRFFDDRGYIFGTNNALLKIDITANPTNTSITKEENRLNLFYDRLMNEIKIQINASSAGSLIISVYNIKGQKVYEKKPGIVEQGKQEFFINTSQFDTGMYFATVKAKESFLKTKLIIID